MAYKFQIGPAQLSGALTQEGTIEVRDQSGTLVAHATDAGVLSASSDLSAGGALDIAGAGDIAGAVSLAAAGVATSVRGTLAVTEAATFNGDVTLGNAPSDVVEFQADVSSSIIPAANNFHDLGGSSDRWANVYAVNIDASGPISGTELTGTLQYSLDDGGAGAGITPFTYDNSAAGITVAVSGAAQLAADEVIKWDITDGKFVKSTATDDGTTFKVAAALSASNNLEIGGGATIAAGVIVSANGIEVTGNSVFENELQVVGATNLDGNVALGDSAADAISFNGGLATDIIPGLASTYDLGSSLRPFQAVYADNIFGNISFDTETFTGAGTIAVETDLALANFSTALQLDLPAGANGKVVRIKRIGSANVTLSASVAGETIFDETNGDLIVLETAGAAVTCVFSGSSGAGDWYII